MIYLKDCESLDEVSSLAWSRMEESFEYGTCMEALSYEDASDEYIEFYEKEESEAIKYYNNI